MSFFLFIFSLAVFAQWLYSLGHILLRGILFDFGYFLRAVENSLSFVNPYFAENFVYPPPVLFLYFPFAVTPLFFGQILWTVFSFSCLFFSIFIFAKLNKKIFFNASVLFFVPFLFFSFPVRWTFGLGQINFLLLLFIVLTYYFAFKNKEIWAGICLGSAIILKMSPLFLLLYFLTKKRFKIAVVSFFTIIFLLLISGFVFGFSLVSDYFLIVVPRLFNSLGKDVYYNQAFSGFFSRIISNSAGFIFANVLFAGAVAGVDLFFYFKKNKFQKNLLVDPLEYSLAINTMLLINGFSWQHHFVLLVFSFMAIFFFLQEKTKLQNRYAVFFLPVFISWFLVSFNFKNPSFLGNSFLAKMFLSHVFLGTFFLWLTTIFFLFNFSDSS